MLRITDVVLLSAAIAGAIYTYNIKHEAELSAKRLNTLQAQISAERRKIALLEADWALETAPGRLEKIAAQFSEQLKLRAMESSQIIDTSELPGLRQDREDSNEETFADRGDDVVTGGISSLILREDDN